VSVLVVSLTTPRDAVLYARDGEGWLLVGSQWVRLGSSHVTSIGGGIGGRVLTASERTALVARVGEPR
jgi:hypothetical protein